MSSKKICSLKNFINFNQPNLCTITPLLFITSYCECLSIFARAFWVQLLIIHFILLIFLLHGVNWLKAHHFYFLLKIEPLCDVTEAHRFQWNSPVWQDVWPDNEQYSDTSKSGSVSRLECKNGLKMGNSYMKNAVGCNCAAVSLNYILLYVNLETNYRHNTRLSLCNAEYTIRKRWTRLAQLFYKHVHIVKIWRRLNNVILSYISELFQNCVEPDGPLPCSK